MTTYSKSGSFGWAGGGKSGAIVDLWATSRFAAPPAENEAPPSGSPDAGPVTTGEGFGNPGAYLIENIAVAQDYYVRIQYGGNTYWGPCPLGTLGGVTGGGGGGAVDSVFGRAGVVTAQSGDYNVSEVTGAAPLASPALTGVPTAPTASNGTDTTQVATTAFVLANGGSGGLPSGYSAQTGAYTTLPSDWAIECTSGSFTLTLGTSGFVAGQAHLITNTGSGTITMAVASGSYSGPLALEPSHGGVVVFFDGTNWAASGAYATPVAGDLSGSSLAPTVAKVNGITLSGTPSTGQVLTATSGSAADWQNPSATAGVSTFNTRSGTVVPASGDYTVGQVTGAAPLASPTLTGTPTTPTAAPGTNTTEIASTAFVAASFAPIASPTLTGTPAAPTAAGTTNTTQIATTAFVHGAFAPLASPTLTGVPAAPTATPGTNTTQLATTAFVTTATAGGAANVLTLFNVKNPTYGATGNGTTDDTAAINAAVAACIAAGGGIVYFPEGTYKTSSAITVATTVAIEFLGAGWTSVLKPTSATAFDCIRWFDSTTNSGFGPSQFGCAIRDLLIDGTGMTNTTGTASGLHLGDTFHCLVDHVCVQNYTLHTSSTNIGFWFDNFYTFTEQLHGSIFSNTNQTGVKFDINSGGGTGTTFQDGSFERCDLKIYINQGASANDGVVVNNGAFIVNGFLGIYGNFGVGSALTSAAIRVTGAAPSGSAQATNSNISYTSLDVGIEVTATGTGPYSVFFGSTNNYFSECSVISWNTGATAPTGVFQAPNHPTQFNVTGMFSPVTLNASLSDVAANVWWNPHPTAIGHNISPFSVSGTVTFDPTGASDSSTGYSLMPFSPTGNLTGAIIAKGLMDGQTFSLVNDSAFTITFAASGTSNVADGVSDVIAANTSRKFVYLASASLWFREG